MDALVPVSITARSPTQALKGASPWRHLTGASCEFPRQDYFDVSSCVASGMISRSAAVLNTWPLFV